MKRNLYKNIFFKFIYRFLRSLNFLLTMCFFVISISPHVKTSLLVVFSFCRAHRVR